MPKANDTSIYSYDEMPSLLDYLFGSDINNNKKNRSYKIKSIIELLNSVNGKNAIQYQFSDGTNPEIDYLTPGALFTNNNETAVGDFTQLIFNKNTVLPIDVSPLFTKLGELENVVIRLENPEDPNNFFNFKVVSFEDLGDCFAFGVQDFNGLYLGELQNQKYYSFYFDIKSATNEADKFTSVGTISLVGNTATISTGFAWMINAGNYANIAAYSNSIPFSSTGKQRFVLFVANVFNTFQMISGPESVSNPIAPPIPNNTLQVTLLLVTDGEISEPILPDLSDYATIDYVDGRFEEFSNVDNTSDIDKPVSTAQASADAATLASANAYTDAKVSGAYIFKGNKTNYADLVATGQHVNGYVYNLLDTEKNYAWNGSAWDDIGGSFDISGKEDISNKTQDIEGNKTSTTFYASVKQLYDWGVAKFVQISNIKTVNGNSLIGTGNVVTPDMDTTTTQTVSGVKTFLDGKFGLRNTANTFTSFFANAVTASRTWTFPDKNGTVAMTSDIVAQLSGTVNRLVKFGTATTGVSSRITDDGTNIGIDNQFPLLYDFLFGYLKTSRTIGIEESINTVSGRDFNRRAGRTVNYAPATPVFHASISVAVVISKGIDIYNNDLYTGAPVTGVGMYKQTGVSGVISSVNSTPNRSLFFNKTNGDLYILPTGNGNPVKYTGGIGGSSSSMTGGPTFAISLCVTPSGKVYVISNSADIYRASSGSMALAALGQASRQWTDIKPDNLGNVLACVSNGDIYLQTAESGNFVGLGQVSRNYNCVLGLANGKRYAGVLGGDIYLQTGGVGAFIAIGAPSKNWVGLAEDTATGNVYAVTDVGEIYVIINNAVGTANLDGGTIRDYAGTGKGTGKSYIERYTGQKTASGTDMQIETLRERLDENGFYIYYTHPVYANDAAADADTNLPSKAYYKITGNRGVFQKP
jgi:hypothetical protein